MKVLEIFERACSILSQNVDETEELKPFVLLWTEMLVQEALLTENSLRRFEGKAELETAPSVTSFNDDVPYYPEICVPALVYGLASHLYNEDGDMYLMQEYRARFISALTDIEKVNPERVVDVYA